MYHARQVESAAVVQEHVTVSEKLRRGDWKEGKHHVTEKERESQEEEMVEKHAKKPNEKRKQNIGKRTRHFTRWKENIDETKRRKTSRRTKKTKEAVG